MGVMFKKNRTIVIYLFSIALFAAERGLDVSGLVNMALAISLWSVSGLSFTIATIAAMKLWIVPLFRTVRIVRPSPDSEEGQVLKQMSDGTKATVPFYPSRRTLPGLFEELREVEVVWGLWHTGDVADSNRIFDGRKIRRLILLHP